MGTSFKIIRITRQKSQHDAKMSTTSQLKHPSISSLLRDSQQKKRE